MQRIGRYRFAASETFVFTGFSSDSLQLTHVEPSRSIALDTLSVFSTSTVTVIR